MAKIGAEIFCGNEQKVAARVEVARVLDAPSILSGFLDSDPFRCPVPRDITNGTQLFCRRCSGKLSFRFRDGVLVDALVGHYEVQG